MEEVFQIIFIIYHNKNYHLLLSQRNFYFNYDQEPQTQRLHGRLLI